MLSCGAGLASVPTHRRIRLDDIRLVVARLRVGASLEVQQLDFAKVGGRRLGLERDVSAGQRRLRLYEGQNHALDIESEWCGVGDSRKRKTAAAKSYLVRLRRPGRHKSRTGQCKFDSNRTNTCRREHAILIV